MTTVRRVSAAALDLVLPLAAAIVVGAVLMVGLLAAAPGGPGILGIVVAGMVLVVFSLTWVLGALLVELVQPLRRGATPGERWLGFEQAPLDGSRWASARRLLVRGVVRTAAMWGVASLWFIGVVERSHGVRWFETALAAVATLVVLGCAGWPLRDGATAVVDRLVGTALRDVREVSPSGPR